MFPDINNLNKREIIARLTVLDKELKDRGIPLHLRPLECFKKLFDPVSDVDIRSRIFDFLTSWLIENYGDRALWDEVVRRVPILVRGDVYLLQVPFVAQDTAVRVTDCIEELADAIRENLSREELQGLMERATFASEEVLKLYTLHVDDHIFDDTERGLINRALFDFEHASTSLKQSGDTQNAIFHSHAAAEKFLKVALKRATGAVDLKRFRHNLRDIFNKLVQTHERFRCLETSVNLVQDSAPTMDIRYSEVSRSTLDAVAAYNASLRICGVLAAIWLFDAERGSRSSDFVPGHFYTDSGHRTFYCQRILDVKVACLTLFLSNPGSWNMMADIEIEKLYSSLYLEVTNPSELRILQTRFDFQLAQRKSQLVTQKETTVKLVSGPEGSYVLASRTNRR